MICPAASIDSTPQTSPKTFTNWARALSFTATRSFRPTTRGEVVEIIRQAEDFGQRVKWTGSLWSFMGNYVSNDVVIESDGITGAVPSSLILGPLTLADESIRDSLFHIRGGTKVFNVNRLLHGLPAAANGGGADESGLTCPPGMALKTLGGSGGQSIAGVMATGSHGGDLDLPPIADCVQAIHLIGPGGQEFWIERSAGLTAGSEADTQAALARIVDADPAAAMEMCNGIIVKKDDGLFRAALVSVGRMGFVYSLVVQAVSAFKLSESRRSMDWEDLKEDLSDTDRFNALTAGKHFLNVIIKPFTDGGRHHCTVSERMVVSCDTPSGASGSGGGDFTDWLCHQQDVSWIAALLLAAIAILVVVIVGLVEAVSIMLATAAALVFTFFWVGWILAALVYLAIAVLVAIIIALGLTVAALVALLGFITFAGGVTPGQLVAAITNFAFTVGLQDLMRLILVRVFDSVYPSDSSATNISWKVMDTYGYAAEDFCQKVDSLEIAFDVAVATSGGGGYVAFIDEVLAIFDELYGRHIAVACVLALRWTRRTEALIGMTKFDQTCHIEIPAIRDFAGNAEFLERVQRAAIAHGGVPHWGQLMATYTGSDILDLHGADLTLWRQKLTQLIREGGGHRSTFSNTFTSTYNLEPFDETPITAVQFDVTVGDDSLADTDVFRPDRSEDTVSVRLTGRDPIERPLNDGEEWHAGTFHSRRVEIDGGAMLGEIRSVTIKHHAAGDDINADNWTAALIVVSAVLADGTLQEITRAEGVRFRKNDHQIWEQVFI